MNNSIHLKLTPSISFIFMSFAVQPHQNSENWILAQRSWVASRNLYGGEAKSAKLLRMFDFTRCNFIRFAAVTNEALVGKPLWPPLLETFLWKSPSPVTGLQKCNQQSYVLFARSSSLRAASSNFQSRKVGEGKTNSRRRFFDEWILTHLFCWDAKLSPWTNFISQVVFFAEQISQYTIQLGRRLDSVCWRQKLSWREMFSVFWNLFAFTGFSSMLTWPCHALVSVNIKDFFPSLASQICEPSFSKQILVIKSLSFLSSSSTLLICH